MKFECQNVFMIRTPELSFEYLLEYYQQDRDVYEFIKNNEILDNFFRKALLISSKSLYRSYINRPTNVKQYDNLIKSLYKYFIRSTTRTTPFGYYASVALGEFATTTCLVKGRSIVDIKIDNEWINSIIYQIENENENLSKLQFSFNKICYKSGDRFKNPCFTNYGKQADNGQEIVNEVSIKWSPLIELIKEKSTNFVSYKELKKYIALYYPTVSEKKIDTTLKTLVENEFLLSELRIPAYCSDTLKHVIDVLNSTNICSEKVKKLNVIYDKIVLFKKSQQIECLEEIVSELEFIYNIPNVLLLNLGNNYISKTLQYDIKERIENFANTLSYLPLEYDFLKKFKNKFIAKYGLNVEVPLLNIIDENDFNGLSYLEEPGVKNSNYHQEIHTVIESKIMEAIINNQEEVCLCKTDFKNIPSFHYKKSFDLNVLITKVDNDYKLYVGPNKCSCKAGNMFQRFSDCFERCDMEKYNNIYEKEEQLFDNSYLIVELREHYTFGKNSNVINNTINYKYFISFGNLLDENRDMEILLDDIYIGISPVNGIYAKSKKYGKKLRFVKDNMLNLNLNNKIVKFLKRISDDSDKFPENRLFLTDFNYKYMPRVSLEGVIFSPRKWTFGKFDFKAKNFADFIEEINIKKKMYHINDKVYYVYLDNRMIVDLNIICDLQIIFNEYRKSGEVRFEEIEEGLFSGSIVKDGTEKKYVNECVVSLISRYEDKQLEYETEFVSEFNDVKGKFILAEEGWVYFKLYGAKNRETELLTVHIPCLLGKLNYPNHFYLRYEDDEGEHIRVRIKFKDEEEAISKLNILLKWGKELREKNVVGKFVFDQYERENNRYGGSEMIQFCERIFFKDSFTVENLLMKYDVSNSKILEKLYLGGIVFLLKNLCINLNEMLWIVDYNQNFNSYRNVYRKNQREFIGFVKKVLEEDMELDLEMKIIYEEEKKELNMFREILNKAKNDNNNLTNTKENIILSIIHMYCNRLTGKREFELKYLEICRHALYHIVNSQKYIDNDTVQSK